MALSAKFTTSTPLFETVQLEISAFLFFALFLFKYTLYIYHNAVPKSSTHLWPLRDLKCKSGFSQHKILTYRVNWEVFVRCAYWIRFRVSQTRAKTPSWSISNPVNILYVSIFVCGPAIQ